MGVTGAIEMILAAHFIFQTLQGFALFIESGQQFFFIALFERFGLNDSLCDFIDLFEP